MSVLDTLITNRTQGATYGIEDMNRVCEAIDYLAEWLQQLGISVTVNTSRYTRTQFPTPAVLDSYIAQLQTLRTAAQDYMHAAPSTPAVGSTQNYMTVADANNIEVILQAIKAAAEVLEGFRSWFLTTSIPDGDVTAFFDTEETPGIDYEIDDSGNLYAIWDSRVPEPFFELDSQGNLYLLYLEGENDG